MILLNVLLYSQLLYSNGYMIYARPQSVIAEEYMNLNGQHTLTPNVDYFINSPLSVVKDMSQKVFQWSITSENRKEDENLKLNPLFENYFSNDKWLPSWLISSQNTVLSNPAFSPYGSSSAPWLRWPLDYVSNWLINGVNNENGLNENGLVTPQKNDLLNNQERNSLTVKNAIIENSSSFVDSKQMKPEVKSLEPNLDLLNKISPAPFFSSVGGDIIHETTDLTTEENMLLPNTIINSLASVILTTTKDNEHFEATTQVNNEGVSEETKMFGKSENSNEALVTLSTRFQQPRIETTENIIIKTKIPNEMHDSTLVLLTTPPPSAFTSSEEPHLKATNLKVEASRPIQLKINSMPHARHHMSPISTINSDGTQHSGATYRHPTKLISNPRGNHPARTPIRYSPKHVGEGSQIRGGPGNDYIFDDDDEFNEGRKFSNEGKLMTNLERQYDDQV